MLDFGKEIHQIDEQDLQQKLVTDGYYESRDAEYKSDWPKPPGKLARTLSAFANTEGGWLFIGVEADSNTNIPTSMPGVALSAHPAETLSNIARRWVDPAPPVDPHIVELATGQGVVVVQVREGTDPPYVDRCAEKIYRRTGCVSERDEPVRDRYALEALFQKSRDAAALLQLARARTYYAGLLPCADESAPDGLHPRMPITAQLYPRVGGGPLLPRLFTPSAEQQLRHAWTVAMRDNWTGTWSHRQSRIVWRSQYPAGAWPWYVFALGVDGSIECTQITGTSQAPRTLKWNDFRRVIEPGCRAAARVYSEAGYGGSVDFYLEGANLEDAALGLADAGRSSALDPGVAERGRLEVRRRTNGGALADDEARERLIEDVMRDVKRFFGQDTYDPPS